MTRVRVGKTKRVCKPSPRAFARDRHSSSPDTLPTLLHRLADGLIAEIGSSQREHLLREASKLISAWFATPHGERLKHLASLWYRTDDLDEFGLSPRVMEALRPIFQFLFFDYFRVQVRGVEHIPPKGPAILVANHAGALPYDGAMVHLSVFNHHKAHRGVRFLVDDFIYRVPLVRTLIERIGGVRACHEHATRLLAAGHLILVFPEGTRGISKGYEERYQINNFGRGGFVKLAMRTRVPVIPVAIVGSEEVHPIIWKSHRLAEHLGVPFIPFTPTFPWLGPLGLIPLPSKWSIQFGAPIHFSRAKATDAENVKRVERETHRIRDRIQHMLDSMLASRKSIWI